MFRPARLSSAFTRFVNRITLRERLAGLFLRSRSESGQKARLSMDTLEDRVVPDARPLPGPMILAGSGLDGTVKAYNADTGTLRWSANAFSSGTVLGVRVAAGDFTGDGIPTPCARRRWP